MKFVDIHQHVVYGLDDGPRTLEESADMLRVACQDGIETIIATTHATPGEQDFPLEAYHKRIKELNDYCQNNNLQVRLWPGCEIYYTEATLRHLQDERIPTLAGSRYVLVEFSPNIAYDDLFEGLRQLTNASYLPVLAHIERYGCLVRRPAYVEEIKSELSVRLQINCESLIERQGMRLRRFLRYVFDEQLIDFVATDAHNTSYRPVCMQECREALREIYPTDYVEGLMGGHQMALLPNVIYESESQE